MSNTNFNMTTDEKGYHIKGADRKKQKAIQIPNKISKNKILIFTITLEIDKRPNGK